MVKNIYNKLSDFLPTRATLAGTALALLGLSSVAIAIPAQAVELGEEKTFFNSAPRLVNTSASQHSRRGSSTYYFTIELPANAGESLEAVTVTQKQNLEEIDFDLSDSHAFLGGGFSGDSIPISQIGSSQPADNEVTLVFDEPVLPGETVTVAVDVDENPAYGGVYQFGITAFSQGRYSPGLYIGTGRISFPSN